MSTPATRNPVHRPLQVYAFDPSLDLDLQTARVNRAVVHVRWEDGLKRGPVGEYLEVVDVDPASGCAYEPVDLNQSYLLATEGLPPSEGNPRFHQQMVYAVAMLTIENFEVALGRSVHWSPRLRDEHNRHLSARDAYVPRLRIYPHAMREANAYYSPDKKALLFGYFNALNSDSREGLPGGIVFSCLSYDIIAHEMTHAILDGIHRRMLEASNPDVLAFHEGFADLITILQHFTLPGVLVHQIAQTRGDLGTENLLAKLAVQFGRATQRGNALRDAIGGAPAETGKWERHAADPSKIGKVFEPHARGALLVAAFFDAFVTIYRAHNSDLLRIASEGTGVLRDGALHPDLVHRLAREAGKVARRLLTVCIRALDYLPPVDITFGDFLRAVITSDSDFVPEDSRHYRTALISAFRDWGIYPRDVRTLSVETLRWDEPTEAEQQLFRRILPPVSILRLITTSQDLFQDADGLAAAPAAADGEVDPAHLPDDLMEAFKKVQPRPRGKRASVTERAAEADEQEEAILRKQEFLTERAFAHYFHQHLKQQANQFIVAEDRSRLTSMLGIDLFNEELKFEVHAVRPATRIRRDGRTTTELLVLITQRRKLPLPSKSGAETLNYKLRGGCTLLIDPVSGQVRYAITKKVNSEGRQARQEQFLSDRLEIEGFTARGRYGVWLGAEQEDKVPQEPFRILHRGGYDEQWQ